MDGYLIFCVCLLILMHNLLVYFNELSFITSELINNIHMFLIWNIFHLISLTDFGIVVSKLNSGWILIRSHINRRSNLGAKWTEKAALSVNYCILLFEIVVILLGFNKSWFVPSDFFVQIINCFLLLFRTRTHRLVVDLDLLLDLLYKIVYLFRRLGPIVQQLSYYLTIFLMITDLRWSLPTVRAQRCHQTLDFPNMLNHLRQCLHSEFFNNLKRVSQSVPGLLLSTTPPLLGPLFSDLELLNFLLDFREAVV